MKVLFVCNANMGRSQVAEALFNQLSGEPAKSAGTRADHQARRHVQLIRGTAPAQRTLAEPTHERIENHPTTASERATSAVTRRVWPG